MKLRLHRNQRGYSVNEMLVGVATLGIVGTAFLVAFFNLTTSVEKTNAAYLAISETSQSSTWTFRDVSMAQSTDIADGAPAVSTATFSWNNLYGGTTVARQVTYSLNGTQLVRTSETDTSVVAIGIKTLQFSRADKLITVTIQAEPANNRFKVNDQQSFQIRLRSNG